MASGYCEVSGEFCDSVDIHHIIPREYGGEQGPTIALSPTVHQSLHRLASNPSKLEAFALRFKNPYLLIDLGRCIRESKEKFCKVPSNKVIVSFSEDDMAILTTNANELGMTVPALVNALVKKVLGT